MSELKGACVIGQSGGPTSVINSSVLGALETALDNPSITRVFGMAHGIKGLLNDELYDIDKEDRDELALLRYTPSSALGSCRKKLEFCRGLRSHGCNQCLLQHPGADGKSECRRTL